MKYKIVADSSADIRSMDTVDFASAPLKIITSQKEYVDTADVNVEGMVADLYSYKGKSSTACPGVGDWLDAFADAEGIFCLTISGSLSGSYNAARMAKQDYEERFPERKVYVIDTLSAGPEMKLLADKLAELINEGNDFETICTKIDAYGKKTHLLFMLESLKNLANNGRVNAAVAKVIGLLGIRMVGKASDEGTLQPLDKCRGEQNALKAIIKHLYEMGYQGGKICIAHCMNEAAALQLKAQILKNYINAKIEVYKTGALCSFYAEKGGMLIGFEE
ncbi:MAG: DegV family protein [Ruminococcaceae bacterium]|nr:DegV family protein [Oscillospiraceae bacterium]